MFKFEYSEDVSLISPLLEACGLEPTPDDAAPSTYLMATTAAGGVAGCVGWTRSPDALVIHALAVAPTTRGSGVGAELLAMAMSQIMDAQPVPAVYIATHAARGFFAMFGFAQADQDEIPREVYEHPAVVASGPDASIMMRRYDRPARNLDRSAFRMVYNATEEATLPIGAVLYWRQSGAAMEVRYRGGPVRRGHMIGHAEGDTINLLWHSYLSGGGLSHGATTLRVRALEDGRRELVDALEGQAHLVLREV